MEFIDVHRRVRDAIETATPLKYGKMLFRQSSLPDDLLGEDSFGLEWPRTDVVGMDSAQATRRVDRGRIRILIGLETDDQDEALTLASTCEAQVEDALQQTPANPCSVEGVAVSVLGRDRRVIGRYLEIVINIECAWTRTIRAPA